MIRRFNPVGQGAFYTEQFEIHTVVYDCGSSSEAAGKATNRSLLIQREIQNTFRGNSVIDKVFISHLHFDHVNGLKDLFEHCQVIQVYLPYLTPSQKAIHLLDLSVSANKTQSQFTRSIIEDPYAINKLGRETEDSRPTEVILVMPDDPDVYQSSENDSEQKDKKFIRSGTPIENTTQTDWVYVPFNINFNDREKQLLDALKKQDIEIDKHGNILVSAQTRQISLFDSTQDSTYNKQIYSFNEICDDKNLLNRIREAFASVDGDLNTNSMVVYSGPSKCDRSTGMKSNVWDKSLSGCLYLGDFDASSNENWTKMREVYRNYWNLIHICQVPHHGSSKSYNHHLVSDLAASHYVVSAGYNNQYRHPHALVVTDIIRSRKNIHVVTEQVGSASTFTYSDI